MSINDDSKFEKDLAEAKAKSVYSSYTSTRPDMEYVWSERKERNKEKRKSRHDALWLACFLFNGKHSPTTDPGRITEYAKHFLQFIEEGE